jgi:hypothetical protein
VYGVSWVADDILAHAKIHADHHWCAYRVWHAWWWLITPSGLVALGRVWHRRTFGQGLWAVGVIWLAVLAASASLWLWMVLLMSLAAPFGYLIGTTLSLVVMIPVTLVIVLVGSLVDRARKRSRLFDRLMTDVCWMPDRTAKSE